MEDFLAHEFRSREMLEKKLEYLDERIERQTSSTDCGNTWSARYGYENNILKRLEIMDQLGYSEEEKSWTADIRGWSHSTAGS